MNPAVLKQHLDAQTTLRRTVARQTALLADLHRRLARAVDGSCVDRKTVEAVRDDIADALQAA